MKAAISVDVRGSSDQVAERGTATVKKEGKQWIRVPKKPQWERERMLALSSLSWIALLSAKFDSAEEGTNVDGKVEGGGSRHDMEQVRQEIQRVVGNRVDGRAVNYDDIPGVGGYHWFYDPFSAAHAAMCLEEEGGVGGLHRWNEGG
ncbi:hypothetical protein BHM03_00006901 [Ensete ventricosum]|nr:hypothetical protein BHM03_00006901 [Ensete ventricosum]